MCRHCTARALARATRRDRPSARRGARDDVGRAMARERARESATRARDDDVLARDDDGGWAPVKRRDAAATTREGAAATMFERAPRRARGARARRTERGGKVDVFGAVAARAVDDGEPRHGVEREAWDEATVRASGETSAGGG